MNGSKEIWSNLSTIKTKVESFIVTLVSEEEEEVQKLEHVSLSKLEEILSQNSFNFEVTTKSDDIDKVISTLIDIKGTNMIISDYGENKFSIRNR